MPGHAADVELAAVFGFAAETGGHLDVFSEPGVGTTFRLYLPRIGFGAETRLPAPGPETGGHETILAVDDNAGQRRLVARQLRELGYRTLEAEDGPTALMILNTEPVDLLFTDVVMPGGMSGYDLARLTLSRWPRMKALLTTAFPEARLSGEQLPPDKLRQLAKPYRKAELAQTLREILEA
jgi:CheY-like chemotaxis protein